MTPIREDADLIMNIAVQSALPDHAVVEALEKLETKGGKLLLVSLGKAAWQMTAAAAEFLGDRLDAGVCITKYDHVKGEIPRVICFEAGHPVPDENSIRATAAAEELVKDLEPDDTVLLLISGGGSALFEDPLISLDELQTLTGKLLACGADIREINTLRKRLSRVKGGKFAALCEPAHVFSIVLSDIIGDPLDMIASGPAYPDSSTSEDAVNIIKKYGISVSDKVMELLTTETPKTCSNVETHITGSVRQLCRASMEKAKELGYEPRFLTASLSCEARDAGSFLAAIAREHAHGGKNLAYVCGGETVVHIVGRGKGGRNQELALSCAYGIAGLKNCAVFSVGSDGTDGPTDAAGGYADGETAATLRAHGISIPAVLMNNDAYNALKIAGGLIVTGPTGTNVNDVTVLLIRAENE